MSFQLVLKRYRDLSFSEDQIPEAIQKAIVDSKQEINADDASKNPVLALAPFWRHN